MSSIIGDALFTKTQQRVLGLLYGKPDSSFYTNEIVRLADMGRGTVRRELERLAAAGLLLVTQTGNQRHYQANPRNPIYHELVGIVQKTFGIAEVVHQALLPVMDQVMMAFIFGSLAKGEENENSDIDLLVVSDTLAYADVMTVITQAEQVLARPLNPSIYTRADINKKLREENAFITRVMEQPKIWVKGSEDDINEFRKPG